MPEEFDIVEQSSQDEDSHWEEQNQSRGDGGLKEEKIANNKDNGIVQFLNQYHTQWHFDRIETNQTMCTRYERTFFVHRKIVNDN